MSEERFKLENELLMTKSKAQMINLYLDKLDQINEFEKWLNDNENLLIHYDYESKYDYIYVDDILNKLQELKGE